MQDTPQRGLAGQKRRPTPHHRQPCPPGSLYHISVCGNLPGGSGILQKQELVTATPSPGMETPGAPELGQWPGEGWQGGTPGPGVPSPDPPVSLHSACRQWGTVSAWLPPEGFSSAGLPGDTVVILSFQMNRDAVSHRRETRSFYHLLSRTHGAYNVHRCYISLCL